MDDNIKNLGKVCITPEGVWDVNKEYDRLSLVVTSDPNTQKALSYVSRKHIPAGNISIKNTEYWQLFTTELKLEDITIDENGNVKIGDVVIYQIPLGDALGEIVVDKIKEDLTDYIMTEIRSYMTSMVQELINSFSTQISRLITNGIDIRNNISGGTTNHNIDEVTHYGTVNINEQGRIENIVSGTVNANVNLSGQINVEGDEPEPTPKYLVTINTTPSDAIVTLNGVQTKSGSFDKGSTISIVVSKSGYTTKNEIITNIQQDTVLNITLKAESPQYVFTVNPRERTVEAASSEFTIAIDSVKNSQRYDYEYTIEDSDNLIQTIVKETGGVKVTTNANTLDRTKTATIYFKQYRPEEEVLHVTIPVVITQESDNPSEYIFTSNLINNWNDQSVNNYLGGVPVGGNAYTSPNGIDIVSTKNGESFDYDITQKPSWINFTKDLQNNKLNFALDAVELSSTLIQITGKVVLTQHDSGKTLEFTLIRCKGYVYAIGSPFTYNKNAHYTEDLNIITGFCVSNTGFNYTPGQPSLSSSDEHPNWIGIDDSSFENAQLISTSYYYYYKVRFGIQKNEGNERTGTVMVTVGGDNDINYPIEFTQEGEDTPTPTPTYEFSINPNSANMAADGSTTLEPVVTSTKDGTTQGFGLHGYSDWLHVSKDGNQIVITADANESASSREGYVELVQNESGYTCRIAITQSGIDPEHVYEFSASPTVAAMKADGTTTLNPVITSTKDGTSQEYSLDDKSDWLHVTIANNQVSIVADVNESTFARSGFVRFIQDESGNVCGIDINQGPADQFKIDGSSVANIPASVLNTAVSVVSIVNGEGRSPFTVESSADWITATPAVSISKLSLQISENTDTSSRTGSVVCKQTATNQLVTITITQAGTI